MQKVELHKVCKIGNGFAFKSEDYLETGIPLLRISNINNGIVNFKNDSICVAKNYLETKKDFIVEKGDVVIALSGATTGKYGIYTNDEPSLLNQRIGIIKSNVSKKLDSKYFYFYLNILKDEILRKAGGAAQPNISTKEIGNLEIPLPSLPIQQKIAGILDKSDELRQYNKQLIEKYDALTQSLFLDMFGDPVHNSKKWPEVKFSEVGKLDRGKSKHRPRNAPELLNGPYPLIQTGDIANSGGYVDSYKSTYSEFGLKQSKLWPKGTLCITIAANIAKTGILNFEACFPDSVVGFVPNEKTNNIYVQNWMSFLQAMIEEKAPMAAQRNINLAILKDLEFMMPHIKLQNQFAERVQLIETQKQQAQEALAKSEELFQSLLQRAFKGELE